MVFFNFVLREPKKLKKWVKKIGHDLLGLRKRPKWSKDGIIAILFRLTLEKLFVRRVT